MIRRILSLIFAFAAASLFAEQPSYQLRSWFLADGRDIDAVLATADPTKNGTRVGLKTADGKLILRGHAYSALVLPGVKRMAPGTLKKIRRHQALQYATRNSYHLL